MLDETFPLKTVVQLNSLENKLEDAAFKNKMVSSYMNKTNVIYSNI